MENEEPDEESAREKSRVSLRFNRLKVLNA